MLVKRFAGRSSCVVLIAAGLAVAGGCNSSRKTEASPAKSTIRSTAVRNTTEARSQTELAVAQIEKGNDKKARDLLEKALTLDPTFGPAVNNLGVLDFRAGRLYDAAWNFQNAAKLMPSEPEPINNLGMVLEEAGKHAEAEKQYDAAAKMDLRRVEFTANRARVRVRQGKMDEQTRRLLDYVRQYDQRPEWTAWAREMLMRFDAFAPAGAPEPATTSPQP